MSANQSDLSAGAYGYDTVTAITQRAINSSFKSFFTYTQFPEVTICYRYDDNGSLTAADLGQLIGTTGLDPFSIASGVYHKSDPIAQLDAVGFAFAIRTQIGIPENNSDIPDIIDLNKGSGQVGYRLLMKKFAILNLQESGGGRNLSWTNISQDNSQPWIFMVNSGLTFTEDTSTDAFSSLPVAIKQNVQLLNPDATFNIWRLTLDTTKLSLDSIPVPPGLDTTTDAATYLSKNFITDFFNKIPPSSLELAYCIKPKPFNPSNSVASIIPTDISMLLSPSTSSGSGVPDGSLNTLDLIGMTGKNKMPAPVPFTWDWVDAPSKNGLVAINRNTFAGFVSGSLTGWLKNIALIPVSKVTVDTSGKLCYYAPVTQDSGPQQFILQSSGADILTFSYSQKSSAAAAASIGSLDVEYSASSKVTIANRQLIVTTDTAFYMDIAALGGHSKGYPLKYHAVNTYDISVNINGDVQVTGGKPVVTDTSDKMNSSVWADIAKIITGNSYEDVIKQLQASLTENSFVIMGLDALIANLVRYSNAWIFPGSTQMSFKDVFISDNQDIIISF